MSVRAVAVKIFKHGSVLVRQQHRGVPYARNISQCVRTIEQISPHVQKSTPITNTNNRNVLRNICLQISQQARRILIDNAINRFSFKFGTELIQKAKERGLYGNPVPLLGLVGITLASGGQSILSKDEELEGVCWEIRECVTKIQQTRDLISESDLANNSVKNIDALSIGKPIAKGANAVVYSVKRIASNARRSPDENSIKDYPLALKMMFNYDVQSNSIAILKAMCREIVPAGSVLNSDDQRNYEYDFLKMNKYLPPHPNIVQIFSVFSDFVPELEDCRNLYPAALPKRIDPSGEGRNMSLFLLMKRYHQNLQDYLKSSNISTRTSIFLFAQLLEGVVHMVSHNIAHRDLKSDNILLDLSRINSPLLVVTDFGCCLADSNASLTIPFNSYDVDKGGNTALMAPEIISKTPGTFARLDYSRSDLWAAGAIGYELFGTVNPFYGNKDVKRLSSMSYKEEELPDLPENVPFLFQRLIKNLLSRDPNERLNPEVAANICQLYLWAPNSWLVQGQGVPTHAEILDWLLNLAVKLLCEFRSKDLEEDILSSSGYISYPEYLLISSFLCRAKLFNIKSALEWIQFNNF